MIQGTLLRDAIISAANNLTRNRKKVDELNVFPVPDGDTGTNMSMTISSAAREIRKQENPTATEVASATASALLRGARGNSGVILSLLFRGFSKGLQGVKEISAEDLVNAFTQGVETAYKAVMKPTEGTILTVARCAAEKVRELSETVKDPVELFRNAEESAREALAHTPDQLPILKKAGVVDAGGQGLCFILEGMLAVLTGKGMIQLNETENEADSSSAAMPAGEVEEDVKFHYCTEFIINRENENDALKLRAYLESIGDCVLVVDDEAIIKCHVHTNEPGNALQEALKYGFLTKIKIENMKEQMEARQATSKPATPEYAKPDPSMPIGFVAVAAGDGVQQLFTDLGVNRIVGGGQTMNPSTEDILAAVQAVPAETVVVLPNNKNIIMAAEQAVALADRKVIVLKTRHIPQGLTAMLAFDPELSPEEAAEKMQAAAKTVKSGQITLASRDADLEEHHIHKGDVLCMEGSRIQFTEREINKGAMKLLGHLVGDNTTFITVLYGEDVSKDKAEALEKEIAVRFPDLDCSVVNGGQPVYHYIISVETEG